MATAPVSILPVGTIVTRQARGRSIANNHGRILESYTKTDKLNRRQIWYRVQIIESGLIRDWPGSHCRPHAAAPASA